MNRIVFVLGLMLTATTASASGITYMGRLLDPSGNPVTGNAVQFKVQIRTPSPTNCLMYEETRVLDLTSTAGIFSISVNDGGGTRTDAGTYTLQQIFGNTGSFTFSAGNCGGANVYSPGTTDGRVMAVSFNDGSFAGWEAMPNVAINYVPMSIESYQVGGFTSASLLRVADASGVPQSTSALTPANFTELLALLNGTSTKYLPSTGTGAVLPSLASNSPSTPGDIWFDSGTHQVKFYDGTTVQTVGTSGGSVTSIATGAGLTGGPITSTGTISLATMGSGGTGATKIDYDTYGRVTASSAFTGSDITTGTIGGSTAISTSGNIQTTQDVTARRYFLYDHSGAGPNSVGLQAPSTVGTSYTLIFPATQGSNGQVLKNDGLGNLSWNSPSSADLSDAGSLIKSSQMPANCSASQTLTFSSPTGTWGCSTISVASSAITGVVPVAKGGTNLSSLGTANQILGVNAAATDLEYKTITAGTGVSISHSAGALTINATGSGGTVTQVTATAPLSVATGTTTPALTISQATTSTNGYLSSTDWNTFNGKLSSTAADASYFKNGGNSFGAATSLGTNDGQALTLKTANAPRMTLDTSGNVGIGTVSPAYTLDVNGSARATQLCIGTDCRSTWPSGGAGSVTSVTSANSDIGVASTTTAPVLTLNTGTTANQIVKLDGSAKLPAVDGSALTNVNATKLAGTGVTITTLASGNYLKYDGTAWVNSAPSSADLSDAGSLIKSSQMPANCSAGQTLTFSSPTGTWACSNIAVTASNFGSQSANTVLAAPNGTAGAPTFRTLASADLPTAGTAGTYGSATQVPVLTTDAYGRVTSVTNTAITTSATGLTGIVPVANGGTGTSTGSISGTTDLSLSSGGTGTNVLLYPQNQGNVSIGYPFPSASFYVRPGQPSTSSGSVTITAAAGGFIGTLSTTSGLTLNTGDYIVTDSTGQGRYVYVLSGTTIYTDPLNNWANAVSGETFTIYRPIMQANNGSNVKFLVQGNTGKLGVNTKTPTGYVDANGGIANQNNVGVRGVLSLTHTVSGAYSDYGMQFTGIEKIAGGVTNAGEEAGAVIGYVRNYGTTADNGTLAQNHALDLQYGHLNSDPGATPVTTQVVGIQLQPYAVSGTIGNMYDIFQLPTAGGGTITGKHWAMYQQDPATPSFFAGQVGVGTATPASQLQVNGTITNTVQTYSSSFTCGTSYIDFNTGNFQRFSPSNTIAAGTCTVFIANLVAGASYTLVVTGNAAVNAVTYNFGSYTFKYLPGNSPTIAGKDTIYTFLYDGTTVYVTWAGGY